MTDRRPESDVMPVLGDLEITVLEHIWSHGGTSAKALYARLSGSRNSSLNTIQSTLERLFRKQLLTRHKRGHAYVYEARCSRGELVAGYMRDIVGRFGSDTASSLSAFVESADELDEAALAHLEKLIRQRRER